MLAKAVAILVVFMLTVYAIGLWLNIRTQHLVRQQTIDNTHMHLAYFADRLDRELEHIFLQQAILANDHGLRLTLLQPDFSDMGSIFMQARRIRGIIGMIFHTSPFVSDVGVYFPNLNRVTRWGLTLAPPTPSCIRLINEVQAANEPIFMFDEDFVIGMVIGTGPAVSYVRLCGEALSESLSQMAKAYGLTVVLMGGGTSVLSTGVSPPGVILNSLPNNQEAAYFWQYEGEAYWILSAPFLRFDFELVAFLPNTHVNAPIISTMVGTLFFYAVSMIIGVFVFTVYVSRMIRRINEERRLSERAQLSRLHMQITPHFLYNSFYHIYRLGKMGDMEAVSEMSLKLSKYYEYITRTGDEAATLETEVKHAEDYVVIQDIRFGGQIECCFGPLPSGWRDFVLPKLFLQPLIENSYNHGKNGKNGISVINVGFSGNTEVLRIWVEDDGTCLSDDIITVLRGKLRNHQSNKSPTSLINIRQRFQFMYGDNAQVDVLRGELGGLRVEIAVKRGSL